MLLCLFDAWGVYNRAPFDAKHAVHGSLGWSSARPVARVFGRAFRCLRAKTLGPKPWGILRGMWGSCPLGTWAIEGEGLGLTELGHGRENSVQAPKAYA